MTRVILSFATVNVGWGMICKLLDPLIGGGSCVVNPKEIASLYSCLFFYCYTRRLLLSKLPHCHFRTWPTASSMAICLWTASSKPIGARESWPICGGWRSISCRRWCLNVSRCHRHRLSMFSLRRPPQLCPSIARLTAPRFLWGQRLQSSWQGSRLLYPIQQLLTLLFKCPTWCHPTQIQ